MERERAGALETSLTGLPRGGGSRAHPPPPHQPRTRSLGARRPTALLRARAGRRPRLSPSPAQPRPPAPCPAPARRWGRQARRLQFAGTGSHPRPRPLQPCLPLSLLLPDAAPGARAGGGGLSPREGGGRRLNGRAAPDWGKCEGGGADSPSPTLNGCGCPSACSRLTALPNHPAASACRGGSGMRLTGGGEGRRSSPASPPRAAAGDPQPAPSAHQIRRPAPLTGCSAQRRLTVVPPARSRRGRARFASGALHRGWARLGGSPRLLPGAPLRGWACLRGSPRFASPPGLPSGAAFRRPLPDPPAPASDGSGPGSASGKAGAVSARASPSLPEFCVV